MGSSTRQKRGPNKEESHSVIKPLITIPTYNNERTVLAIAEKALSTGLPVLVVNDGSTDKGIETIRSTSAEIIDFPHNRGKGAAILAAARWAGDKDYSHIITVDADGQHNPLEVNGFVELIKPNPMAIIVGKRDFDNENVPGSSRFGRWWSNLWCRITTGLTIGDSQSGFRAYPVEALNKVRCHGNRYNFEVEVLVRSAWAGIDILDTPISVNYSTETKESSHFNPFWDNYRISVTYTRLVIRNFFPWPHKVIFKKSKEKKELSLSLRHPVKSLGILLKENTTPKEIVSASMLGILLGTLPLIAMHSVSIIFVATRLRLNRLISLNISHLCAPPLVPAIAIEAGYFIRNGKFLTEFNYQTLGHEAHQRLYEYIIGATVIAPFLTLFAGLVVYLLILLYKVLVPAKEKENSLG